MRTWMRLISAVLLAVSFTWSPLRAADETTDQKIKNLQDDVSKIRRDLESLKDEVRKSSVQAANVATDLQDIKGILHDMAGRQAAISRQSAYSPSTLLPGTPPAGLLPTTGTITVQNNYSAPATVRINGRPFAVGVGQALPIGGVPTGTFQYSVDVEGFGTVEALRTDNLPATGYRITIFPRMPY